MGRFLSRFGVLLITLYLLISIVCLKLIESVENAGFEFSMRILWLPIATMIFGVTWWCRKGFTSGGWATWITAITLYPVALFMAWPYVMVVNAILPSQGTVAYEGPVIYKVKRKFRGPASYSIVLGDIHSRELVSLMASREDYENIAIGRSINRSFTLGGFGFPYNWHFEKKPLIP